LARAHGAGFDRAQFRARVVVVYSLALCLAVLPAAGPNGPMAALVVAAGAGPGHFVIRRLVGVPNPTGWLDVLAVVTATIVAGIEPVNWSPALLFQMLTLGGAISFLKPRWAVALGLWSLGTMTAVSVAAEVPSSVGMLAVAGVFLPVLLAGSRRKQARIRTAALRMDAVAETIPMAVWDTDGTTSRMTSVVGRVHDVFGRTTAELHARGVAADVHDDDRATYLASFDRPVTTGQPAAPVELEYRYCRPDGSVVWLRDRAAPAIGPNGPVLRGVTIDITEARRHEVDLHRHHQIVERMAALTIVVERTDDAAAADAGTVLQVVDPIGWGGVDDAVGQPLCVAFAPLCTDDQLMDALATLPVGGSASIGPFALVDPGGAHRHVEVEMFTLSDQAIAVLVTDVTEREQMLSVVRHQARHDDLTGLLNRGSMLQAASDALASGRRCSLLLIDLNDFKSINDTLGHLTGDHFLALIADRLDRLAAVDECVTRLGGDEFAVLLVDPAPGRVDELLECVVIACREPITLHGVALAGSASVGVAETPGDADSAEALLRCADLAMYDAKARQAGASRYVPAMERTTDPLRLLGQLARAFRDDEFVMHFQPKYDARTGTAVAFEALARWQHPQLGVLAPDAFLDLIAVSGQLDALADIALRQAASALTYFPDDVSVAINLTAQNLRDIDLPAKCHDVLASFGVDPGRLIVEITESHVLDASGVTHAVIDDLAARGIRVAVDDFGTGYSSLTHLRSLPLSELKVDRRFVRSMVTDEHDLVIVRSMIDLGHNLGLEVTAEGVEDEPTLELLRTLGCDVIQGFLLGRPTSLALALDGLTRVTPPVSTPIRTTTPEELRR
jgi:diguanylate cyclase (GGDEF)-like protein/PAS domain S-box-containing protein